MKTFSSGFADLLNRFVNYRKASQVWSKVYERNLGYFDSFCAREFPEQPLNQEMIDQWCAKRPTETNFSCESRTMAVREFAKYLKARNLCEITPPKNLKREGYTYIPYAFQQDELHRFFDACDSIQIQRNYLSIKLKKITIPVFFRLLYSTGMRTTEARLLKRVDVDLQNGVISIEKSKSIDQHYVALHESMTALLKEYDAAAEKLIPDRKYFFHSPKGSHYSTQWVVENFRKLWDKANGKGSNAVAYDLRHHYATTNINSWKIDAFEFSDKLNYLSKSMGHRNIESTLYYYSIVPALADIIFEKTSAGMDLILPEVSDDENE